MILNAAAQVTTNCGVKFMDAKCWQISRHELYKKVWEVPMTKLSAQFKLSDVGLAKICKKYNIPRPPRGYWAKKAAGQRVKKIQLPNRSADELIEIRPNPFNDQNSDVPDELSNLIQTAGDHEPITVPKHLRYVHLSSHLKAAEIISRDQAKMYNKLRGYTTNNPCENIPQGHDPKMWKKHHHCLD
jgi:hypothetical protein